MVSDTRFEGATQLQALIDPAGQVTNITVTHSSGMAVLDQAAMACLRRAHFQSALREGHPVAGQFKMMVKWDILPSTQTCDPSMPIGWAVQVTVTPSQTDPNPLQPATAKSVVCTCMNGTERSEPLILSSSGIQRWDEGAIKLMKKTPIGNSRAGCTAGEFHFIAKSAPSSDAGR